MIKKHVITGFLVGLIANALGLLLAATLLGKGDDFMEVIRASQAEGFLGKLISLGAILNLIVFIFYIKKKQDYKARGVLLATILVAILTFLIKL